MGAGVWVGVHAQRFEGGRRSGFVVQVSYHIKFNVLSVRIPNMNNIFAIVFFSLEKVWNETRKRSIDTFLFSGGLHIH